MSQGKGDKDRTADRKSFNDNYDLIDFSKKPADKIKKEQENAEKDHCPAVDNWTNEGGAI